MADVARIGQLPRTGPYPPPGQHLFTASTQIRAARAKCVGRAVLTIWAIHTLHKSVWQELQEATLMDRTAELYNLESMGGDCLINMKLCSQDGTASNKGLNCYEWGYKVGARNQDLGVWDAHGSR